MAKKLVVNNIEHINLKSRLTAKDIGEVVRHKRTRSKFTIEDFALFLDISKDTLTNIEHGTGAVKLSTLLHIFDELGIEMNLHFKGGARE
jgi:transcriptional regulator with XRE-family HTH domain